MPKHVIDKNETTFENSLKAIEHDERKIKEKKKKLFKEYEGIVDAKAFKKKAKRKKTPKAFDMLRNPYIGC